MGALLLIVVVIVAVATLASFVSIAEKNANNRSALLTNLKNENLQVVNAAFEANKSIPLTWSNVNITIRNSNTADSQLTQVKITNTTFNYWFPSWKVLSSVGVVQGLYCVQACLNRTDGLVRNGTLIIPAKGTVVVYLKLTKGNALAFQRNASASITLLTAAGNFFTTVYNPPTAVAQVSITSVSYQDYTRDVVSLNGGQSTAANQSTIVSYTWNVRAATTASGCTAFQAPSDGEVATGRIAQFFQEDFQTLLAQTSSGPVYCLTGPFEVSLTVTDSMGFSATSNPIIVASDSNLAPVATFFASLSLSSITSLSTISGSVETIFGTAPAPGTTYVTILNGGVSTSVEVSNGQYQYTLPSCDPGTVEVSVNTLPPQTFTCPSSALTAGAITPSAPTLDSGQSITLTANPSGGVTPYTYQWYTATSAGTCTTSDNEISGATSSTYAIPTSTVAGTYYYCYIVTDSASTPVSQGSATDLVTVNPALLAGTITSSAPTIDSGQSVTLMASWSDGTSTFTVTWYSGLSATCASDTTIVATNSGLAASPNSQSVSPTISTYYCAVITDSSSGTPSQSVTDAAIQVTVDPALVVPAPTANPASPEPAGTSVTFTAAPSGGSGTYNTYKWSGLPTGCTPSNSQTITCMPTTSWTYSVTVAVTDSNGDTVTSSALIFRVS